MPATRVVIDYVQLGRRVAEARTARGWRQRDLALLADLGESQVGRIERHLQLATLQLDTIVRIADALSVSLDWLTGRTDVASVPSPDPVAGDRHAHVAGGGADGAPVGRPHVEQTGPSWEAGTTPPSSTVLDGGGLLDHRRDDARDSDLPGAIQTSA